MLEWKKRNAIYDNPSTETEQDRPFVKRKEANGNSTLLVMEKESKLVCLLDVYDVIGE